MTHRSDSRIICFGVFCSVAIFSLQAADQIELAVLIADNRSVSALTFARAQRDAAYVLRQAGVKLRWLECSFAEAEHRDPPGCQLPLEVPTVIVKILPKNPEKHWKIPPKALGFSQDGETYIFLPRVELLADEEGISKSIILGHVMAHEIGHALVGEGHSAAGLMRQRFRSNELKLAQRGQLQFSTREAVQIRERIRTLSKAPLKPPDQTSTRSRAAASAPTTSR